MSTPTPAQAIQIAKTRRTCTPQTQLTFKNNSRHSTGGLF